MVYNKSFPHIPNSKHELLRLHTTCDIELLCNRTYIDKIGLLDLIGAHLLENISSTLGHKLLAFMRKVAKMGRVGTTVGMIHLHPASFRLSWFVITTSFIGFFVFPVRVISQADAFASH